MSAPACVDLRKTFPAYRTRPTSDHVKGNHLDPWNLEIPCGRWRATVYPHGGSKLQAWITTGRLGVALEELRDAGAVPWQIGEGEATVVFELHDAAAVLGILKARKRKVLTPEHRARSSAALSRTRVLAQGDTIGPRT